MDHTTTELNGIHGAVRWAKGTVVSFYVLFKLLAKRTTQFLDGTILPGWENFSRRARERLANATWTDSVDTTEEVLRKDRSKDGPNNLGAVSCVVVRRVSETIAREFSGVISK
jgi:hypothetical protein